MKCECKGKHSGKVFLRKRYDRPERLCTRHFILRLKREVRERAKRRQRACVDATVQRVRFNKRGELALTVKTADGDTLTSRYGVIDATQPRYVFLISARPGDIIELRNRD